MSDRANSQPFGRGETWYGSGDIDPNDLGGPQLLGQEKWFEDIGYDANGVKTSRTGRFVKCRCVRNLSGVTLYGKRQVVLDPTGETILGYATVSGQRSVPLDEFLPSSGVRNFDLCWVVMQGPCIVSTPLSGLSTINPGDPVQAVTTTGASTVAASTATAGRVGPAAVGAPTNSTSVAIFLQSLGCMMFAISGATTNQTGVDLLVDVVAF